MRLAIDIAAEARDPEVAGLDLASLCRGAATLAPLGRLQDLPAPPKARRVLLRKGQA